MADASWKPSLPDRVGWTGEDLLIEMKKHHLTLPLIDSRPALLASLTLHDLGLSQAPDHGFFLREARKMWYNPREIFSTQGLEQTIRGLGYVPAGGHGPLLTQLLCILHR